MYHICMYLIYVQLQVLNKAPFLFFLPLDLSSATVNGLLPVPPLLLFLVGDLLFCFLLDLQRLFVHYTGLFGPCDCQVQYCSVNNCLLVHIKIIFVFFFKKPKSCVMYVLPTYIPVAFLETCQSGPSPSLSNRSSSSR